MRGYCSLILHIRGMRPREGKDLAQDRTDRKWWCQDLKSSLCNPKSCVLQTIEGDFPTGLEYGPCSPSLQGSGPHFCGFVNLGNLLNSLSLFYLTYRGARNSHFRGLLWQLYMITHVEVFYKCVNIMQAIKHLIFSPRNFQLFTLKMIINVFFKMTGLVVYIVTS